MRKVIVIAIMVSVLYVDSVLANNIECPKGTTLKRETTPEVSEAWCEILVDGKTVMHGPYRVWWPNGKLGTKGQYHYGKMVGHWRGWYDNGKPQGDEWFDDGRKVKGRYWSKHGKEIPKPDVLPSAR